MSDLFSELQWRGLVYDSTQGANDLLSRGRVTAYSGFDPTASSLHVGNLMPMMMLARLQRAGHSPVALVGGGTGLIGDPSGKTVERTLQRREDVEANVRGIRSQLERFLDFDAPANPARLVDNGEWLNSMSAMQFLRDVGKYFTVNYLLAKESVKRRLESEEGISYTEFSYSLLQAYDFLVLHGRYDCRLQIGGSDQWGNIVAGTDLIRKLRGEHAHGLVTPLLTTSAGTKFGKTEAGTVWLDPDRTSHYQFYQFWFNTDDRDVLRYLKFFTFKSPQEIEVLDHEVKEHAERREAQRALAREVTRLVHGDIGVTNAERGAAIFEAGMGEMSAGELLEITRHVPRAVIKRDRFEPSGLSIVELLRAAAVTKSNSESTRLIRMGGIYVNGKRVENERQRFTLNDALPGVVFVIRKGQKHYVVVKIDG